MAKCNTFTSSRSGDQHHDVDDASDEVELGDMDKPIAPPLRLAVTEPARPASHDEVAASIRTFLQQYAARSGAGAGASEASGASQHHASSTTAQLGRLADNLELESR